MLDVNFDMLEFLEKAESSENLQTYVTGRKRYQFRRVKKLHFLIEVVHEISLENQEINRKYL